MTSQSFSGAKLGRAAAEAITAGVAFGAILWWLSASIVGSFRPRRLPEPYWQGLPWLRTDTSGFGAFIVAAICLATTEYLRLSRHAAPCRNAPGPPTVWAARNAARCKAHMISQAVAETVAIMATGLFGYLSVNQVTHPWSVQLRATHLVSWPTEGTLRMVALLLSVCAVTVLRYLKIRERSLLMASIPEDS